MLRPRPPLLQPLHHLLPHPSTPPAATAAPTAATAAAAAAAAAAATAAAATAVLQVGSKSIQQLLLPADLLLQPGYERTAAHVQYMCYINHVGKMCVLPGRLMTIQTSTGKR